MEGAANGLLSACSTWNMRREAVGPLLGGDFAGVTIWELGRPNSHRSTIGMERAMRIQVLASKVAESTACRQEEP